MTSWAKIFLFLSVICLFICTSISLTMLSSSVQQQVDWDTRLTVQRHYFIYLIKICSASTIW